MSTLSRGYRKKGGKRPMSMKKRGGKSAMSMKKRDGKPSYISYRGRMPPSLDSSQFDHDAAVSPIKNDQIELGD